MTPLQRWLLRRAQRIPSRVLAMHHAELVAGVSGRVVEIGAGAGNFFAHYPATVTELFAIGPDLGSCRAAVSTSAVLPFPVIVFNGNAEQLPVERGSADVVVCSEVLCSVAEPASALGEIRRVLRQPGGELRVYEHVLATRPGGRAIQRVVDFAGWPTLLGGCHTARDTYGAINCAGFIWECHRRVWQASMPLTWPAGPHILALHGNRFGSLALRSY